PGALPALQQLGRVPPELVLESARRPLPAAPRPARGTRILRDPHRAAGDPVRRGDRTDGELRHDFLSCCSSTTTVFGNSSARPGFLLRAGSVFGHRHRCGCSDSPTQGRGLPGSAVAWCGGITVTRRCDTRPQAEADDVANALGPWLSEALRAGLFWSETRLRNVRSHRVGPAGLEPATHGLKVRCSTT